MSACNTDTRGVSYFQNIPAAGILLEVKGLFNYIYFGLKVIRKMKMCILKFLSYYNRSFRKKSS